MDIHNGHFTQANITKEFGGEWSVSLQAIATEVSAPSRGEVIEVENQPFRVSKVREFRQYQEKHVSIDADHIIFDLEKIKVMKGKVPLNRDEICKIQSDDEVIIWPENITGDWLVDYQMKAPTISHHLDQLFEFTEEAGFSYEVVGTGIQGSRTISISKGSVYENLQEILRVYNARFIPDGHKIVIYPADYSEESGIQFEYALNNVQMSRQENHDAVINKIYAEAQIVGPPDQQFEEYPADTTVGEGYPEVEMHFGELVNEAELEAIAQEYLDVYSDPIPVYNVDVAELKHIDGLPYGGWEIDLGKEVAVSDPELGINEMLVVKSYSYSLLEGDKNTSSVTLGSLDVEALPPTTELLNIDNLGLAQMIMDWLNQEFFGGTPADFDENLKHLSKKAEILDNNRITLHATANVLGAISYEEIVRPKIPDHYPENYRIYNPINEIRNYRVQTFDVVARYIERYIDTVVGADVVYPYNYTMESDSVADKINEAFAEIYGLGGWNVEPRPDPSDIWGDSIAEYCGTSTADRVIAYAYEQAGNPTRIYTELGGGKDGFIPALNNLHQRFINWSNSEASRFVQTIKSFLVSKILGGNIEALDEKVIEITPRVSLSPKRPAFYEPPVEEPEWPEQDVSPDVPENYITLFKTLDAVDEVLDGERTEYTEDYHRYDPIPKIESYRYIMPSVVTEYVKEYVDTIIGSGTGTVVNKITELNEKHFKPFITHLIQGIDDKQTLIKVADASNAPNPPFYANIGSEMIKVDRIVTVDPGAPDELNVLRGVEGTTASSYPENWTVERVDIFTDPVPFPNVEEELKGDIPAEYMGYAGTLFDYIVNNVGNPTHIPMNLGGGRNGVIGAINKLYAKIPGTEISDAKPIEERWEEARGLEAVKAIQSYIENKIFGGDIQSVNDTIVRSTEVSEISWGFLFTVDKDVKVITDTLLALTDFIDPDEDMEIICSKYEEELGECKDWDLIDLPTFVDENITGELSRRTVEDLLEFWIDSVVGDVGTFDDDLCERINNLYELAYDEKGMQDIIEIPSTLGRPDLPEELSRKLGGNPDTPTYNRWESMARDILQYVYDKTGNPTKLYLELEGGREGIIPSMNMLYEQVERDRNIASRRIRSVINYLDNEIFGGETSRLHSDLVDQVPITQMDFEEVITQYVRTLDDVADTFIDYNNPAIFFEEGERYGDEVAYKKVEEVPEIDQRVYTEHYINLLKFYVDTRAEGQPIAHKINEAFEYAWGYEGTIEAEPLPDEVEISDELVEELGGYPERDEKNRWEIIAKQIVNYAYEKAGNPAEVYIEIDGGEEGFIPSINKLYREVRGLRREIPGKVNSIRRYLDRLVFGGNIKALNDDLLSYTPTTTVEFLKYPELATTLEVKKINGAVLALSSLVTTLEGTKDEDEWSMMDFDNFLGQRITSEFIEDILKLYVDTMVTTPVIDLINDTYDDLLYEDSYTALLTPPTELPDDLIKRLGNHPEAEEENRYEEIAKNVRDYALNKAGNPTGIYVAIGGGRNGIIPSLNELFSIVKDVAMQEIVDTAGNIKTKKSLPRFFTSAFDPEDVTNANQIGTEGDVWIKYEEGEE